MRLLTFFGPLQLRYGAAAILSTLGIAQFSETKSFEELTRPIKFWQRMFPIYFEYRFHQYMNPNGNLEHLHAKFAPVVLDILLDLKGIYIKFGQVLSQRPDYCPEIYRKHFMILLDSVPGVNGATARKIVETNLGIKIEDIFEHFDDVPLGSASIGQAHYAKLKDGREVVVKFQLPDTSRMFQTDIQTVNTFTRFAMPEQILLCEEFERQFLLEFDFEREAWALETIGNNLKDMKNVIIPKPVPNLVRRNVLTMDYIPGTKLIDAVTMQAKNVANSLGMPFDEFSNSFRNPSWRFKLKLGCHIIYHQLMFNLTNFWNAFLGRFYSMKPLMKYVDISRLYDELLEAHGKQFLIDGVFNGDPHPGNILVTPDGKLGLIDFGQVKQIDSVDRLNAARMILYLSQGEKRKEEVVKLASKVGFETKNNDPEVVFKSCVLAFDRDDLEMTEGMGLHEYVEKLGQQDPSNALPEQYIIAVRMMVMLRGLAAILGPSHPTISLSHRWLHFATDALKASAVNNVLNI